MAACSGGFLQEVNLTVVLGSLQYTWRLLLSLLVSHAGPPAQDLHHGLRAWLADVAAPILKLCPLKWCLMTSVCCEACCTLSTNCPLLIGEPFSLTNNAPGRLPLIVR